MPVIVKSHWFFSSATIIAAFLLVSISGNIVTGQDVSDRLFDHHVHVLSPRLVSDWKSVGMEFSNPDKFYTDSTFILNQTELKGAFLISMAHLYTTEEFRAICPTDEMEWRLVAAENDFIAVSVARSPARFVGFYSVNLFRDYAIDELNRCKANPNLTGLKLHLPTCGFDLQKDDHWKRLAEVLAWAERENVPVLLHLTAGEDVELDRASWFWETIIEPHQGLELYLAHLGSVGGFNESSENILRAYDLRRRLNPKFRQMAIFFDLSGAIIGPNSEIPPTTDERCKQLSELILQIGVERFLFASDYPVFSISEARSQLMKRLVLSAKDLHHLLANHSRLFDSDDH